VCVCVCVYIYIYIYLYLYLYMCVRMYVNICKKAEIQFTYNSIRGCHILAGVMEISWTYENGRWWKVFSQYTPSKFPIPLWFSIKIIWEHYKNVYSHLLFSRLLPSLFPILSFQHSFPTTYATVLHHIYDVSESALNYWKMPWILLKGKNASSFLGCHIV